MNGEHSPRTIRGVDHWTLTVSDLARAVAFYEGVMGWRRLDQRDTDDDLWGPLPGRDPVIHSARFVRDGQRVEIVETTSTAWSSTPKPEVNHLGLSHMTVTTGPARAAQRTLHEHGVEVRRQSLGSFAPESPESQFLFEDPDGNVIETYEADDDWSAFAGIGATDPDTPTAAGIGHLSHWSLCIADPARTVPFYRHVLGWAEVAEIAWEGSGPSRVMDVGPARLTTWLLGSDDQRIEIIHFDEPGVVERRGSGVSAPGLSHITMLIDDVRAAAAHLRSSGVVVQTTSGTQGQALVFHDPEGNLVRAIPDTRSQR